MAADEFPLIAVGTARRGEQVVNPRQIVAIEEHYEVNQAGMANVVLFLNGGHVMRLFFDSDDEMRAESQRVRDEINRIYA